MNYLFLTIMFFVSSVVLSQEEISIEKADQRQEISMSETSQSNKSGIWRYYRKGETEPFTGILYAQYPNGNWESRQEFVDGLGHGNFINYYETGIIREIGTYNQDRVEGPVLKFHKSGNLQAEGTYKDWRIKVSVWNYYDENGLLIDTIDYGEKGSIEEVNEYYNRGDIPFSWYSSILITNGFDLTPNNK